VFDGKIPGLILSVILLYIILLYYYYRERERYKMEGIEKKRRFKKILFLPLSPLLYRLSGNLDTLLLFFLNSLYYIE